MHLQQGEVASQSPPPNKKNKKQNKQKNPDGNSSGFTFKFFGVAVVVSFSFLCAKKALLELGWGGGVSAQVDCLSC